MECVFDFSQLNTRNGIVEFWLKGPIFLIDRHQMIFPF